MQIETYHRIVQLDLGALIKEYKNNGLDLKTLLTVKEIVDAIYLEVSDNEKEKN